MAFGVWLLVSTLAKTWRFHFRDESGLLDGTQSGPLIGALWHNRLAVAMPMWKWGAARRPAAGLAALISASRDGGLLARVFERFGVRPVRGSSSRRGAQALLELTSALKDNFHIAITPDGPRGPKYKVQPGVISLAQISGVGILPSGVFIRWKWRLKSWDGFQIPMPFTRCDVVFGPPVYVPRDASPEQREQARLALESTLNRLNPD
jgi:lysophospholipid acyltransferase (LPLAT)-like uncharacterized protein